jgi:ABC-type polar amino acid transport system ATPase subunit
MDNGMVISEAPPRDFFANPPTDRAREFVSKIL